MTPSATALSTTTRRLSLADGVDGAALATALGRVSHPGLGAVVDARVDQRTLVVTERAIRGDVLASEPPHVLTDKVLALGQELVPALAALAEQGVAHGALDAQHVVRNDDGALVIVGAGGVLADGTVATSDDDVRALATMMLGLLPAHAHEVTRSGLEALVATPIPLAELPRRFVAIRAAIPVPPGRHIRSIQRLAFPPPTKLPKKSRRYMIRIIVAAVLVGLGLYTAFSAAGSIAWSGSEPAQPERPVRKSDDKTQYIRLTPLPPP